MRKLHFFLSIVLMSLAALAAWGQKSMETPLSGSRVISRPLFRADHRDSTVFRISGTGSDSSGVYQGAQTAGLLLDVRGNAPDITVYVMAGYAAPLPSDVAKADTSSYLFAPIADSLRIQKEGVQPTWQFSDYQPITSNWYMKIFGRGSNGATTVTGRVNRQLE